MEAVEKDIENIYSRLNKISDRVTALEASRPFLTDMIEKNTASNEKMAEAMQAVTTAMTRMEDRITSQGEKIDEQGEKINSIKNDFDEANKKIGKIQEKGKFDILDWLKRNFPWVILVAGLCGLYIADIIPT